MSTTVASVCTDEDVTSVHVCLSKEGSGLINMTMVTMSKVVKNLEFFRDERHHHHHHHHRHHRHRLVDRLKRLSKRFGTFGSLLEMDESEDGCNDVVSLTEAAGAAASLEYQQASEMRPLRVSLGVNQPAGRGHMRQRRYGSTIAPSIAEEDEDVKDDEDAVEYDDCPNPTLPLSGAHQVGSSSMCQVPDYVSRNAVGADPEGRSSSQGSCLPRFRRASDAIVSYQE